MMPSEGLFSLLINSEQIESGRSTVSDLLTLLTGLVIVILDLFFAVVSDFPLVLSVAFSTFVLVAFFLPPAILSE